MPRIHNVGGVRPQLFLYSPAVSNVVTYGNGMGTKNVLKETVHLGLSLVSSLLSMYGTLTVANVSLFSTYSM